MKVKIELIPLKTTNKSVIKMLELVKQDSMLSMIGALKDKKEEMILVTEKMEREMILLKKTMEKMTTFGKKALIKIQVFPSVKVKMELIPLKTTNNSVIKMLELVKQNLMLSMKGALQEKTEMILVMEKMKALEVEREMILLK
jgi:hypothetical protein